MIALAVIWRWLWTGSAVIPEKDTKDVGLGVTLPIYASGSLSAGWWAMLIMMLADITAFVAILFGYFFYWTLRQDFPPPSVPGPGGLWPTVGLALVLGAWALTIVSRRLNKTDRAIMFYATLAIASILSLAGSAAFAAGPLFSNMNPGDHVYSSTVWLIVIWTATHACLGTIMQGYCIARRAAGRMTGKFDIDIQNVGLYWHFVAVMATAATTVIAGFPMLR